MADITIYGTSCNEDSHGGEPEATIEPLFGEISRHLQAGWHIDPHGVALFSHENGTAKIHGSPIDEVRVFVRELILRDGTMNPTAAKDIADLIRDLTERSFFCGRCPTQKPIRCRVYYDGTFAESVSA